MMNSDRSHMMDLEYPEGQLYQAENVKFLLVSAVVPLLPSTEDWGQWLRIYLTIYSTIRPQATSFLCRPSPVLLSVVMCELLYGCALLYETLSIWVSSARRDLSINDEISSQQ